ncbi:MAG: hypothetical protein GF308_03555 [Candidatus Heimdallarchaeota archaeon]|nr:hypothetical protein [Candidatus Heimdallarchaeota archaeon]
MKFIIFVKLHSPDDFEKVIKINNRRIKLFEKEPDITFKTLFPPHIMNSKESFLIVETDNETHLMDYLIDYLPALEVKIYPIMDFSQAIEYYEKSKR